MLIRCEQFRPEKNGAMSRVDAVRLAATSVALVQGISLGAAVARAQETLPIAETPPASEARFDLHFQFTSVTQYHPGFSADYSGQNSLIPDPEHATTVTSTLFLGARLWHGAELYVNPEMSGGSGLSSTLGIAGFTNGEATRVGSPEPHIYLARLMLRQTIALGPEMEPVEEDQNQLAGRAAGSAVVADRREIQHHGLLRRQRVFARSADAVLELGGLDRRRVGLCGRHAWLHVGIRARARGSRLDRALWRHRAAKSGQRLAVRHGPSPCLQSRGAIRAPLRARRPKGRRPLHRLLQPRGHGQLPRGDRSGGRAAPGHHDDPARGPGEGRIRDQPRAGHRPRHGPLLPR